MKKLIRLVCAAALLTTIESSSKAADTWKTYKFDEGISLSSPVELSRIETESGVVFIGIEASGLPNPKFTRYALAIVPLTDEQKRVEQPVALKKATESAWNNKFNRELNVLSSEATVWRGRESVLTLAKSRFAALPYTQYHVDRSFIHAGVRYSLSASQLMENTNRIAMSEFGLVPSEAELRLEERRIRRSAERFFNSFNSQKGLGLAETDTKPTLNEAVDASSR